MPYMPPDVADYYAIPNPDPSRHYRWLAADPKRLSRWLMTFGNGRPGYSLECGATAEDTKVIAEKLGLIHYFDSGLNRIRCGDHYLASIPMEEYERRIAEMKAETADALRSTRDEFRDKLDSIPHVKSFEREVEEVEDRKAFAARESNNRVGYTPTATP